MSPPAEPPEREVRLMTHHSFDISEEVLDVFESQHNARVEILKAGDAGVALNQAILSKDNPLNVSPQLEEAARYVGSPDARLHEGLPGHPALPCGRGGRVLASRL